MRREPLEHTADLVTTGTIDQERSVQLVSLIGRVFAVVIPALCVAVAARIWPAITPEDTIPVSILGAWALVSIALVWGGVWFGARQRIGWAGIAIVSGIQLAFLACQSAWIWKHGLDAVILTSLMVHIITIGLAYVLSGLPMLLFTTGFTNVATAVLVFVFAPQVDPRYNLLETLGSWIITNLIAWLIALLIFASAITYNRALEQLGALRSAYDRAQQLDALKDQFITHVNHELRTPIMTLQGTLDFLHDAGRTMNDEQYETLFAKTRRSAERLVALLSNILDIRNIEGQRTVAQDALDVRLALDDARALVDPLGTYPIIVIQVTERAILGDADYLQQILVNLLGNAIKYSPERTPVEVAVRGIPIDARERDRHEALIELRIRDHGLGIPPDQIPLLFHRFVRLPRDLASNIPGSGVGLYICKLLIERMGGTIAVESQGIPGDGSTFIVCLPATSLNDRARTLTRPRQIASPSTSLARRRA